MADTYDNTNRGAAFAPFETQRLILQGKINDNNVERKTVFIKDQTQAGKTIIEVYEKIGVLFENDKKGNEAAPDYTGPFNEVRRLAAWRKAKDGKPYMTFNVSDAKPQQAQPTEQAVDSVTYDDIPF